MDGHGIDFCGGRRRRRRAGNLLLFQRGGREQRRKEESKHNCLSAKLGIIRDLFSHEITPRENRGREGRRCHPKGNTLCRLLLSSLLNVTSPVKSFIQKPLKWRVPLSRTIHWPKGHQLLWADSPLARSCLTTSPEGGDGLVAGRRRRRRAMDDAAMSLKPHLRGGGRGWALAQHNVHFEASRSEVDPMQNAHMGALLAQRT